MSANDMNFDRGLASMSVSLDNYDFTEYRRKQLTSTFNNVYDNMTLYNATEEQFDVYYKLYARWRAILDQHDKLVKLGWWRR